MLDGTLGSIDATVHRVEIRPVTKPIRLQPYRAGHYARDMIREEVNRMLEAKVVRPSTGEWESPVVVVPKKDGSTRFCVDYRRLNAMTKRDSYPIPQMEDCIDSLGDALVFSRLDCNAGYWKIPMPLDGIDKTASTCHMGTSEYLNMAFGLTNAPATLQRALDIILFGITWQTCLVDFDDVIVFSDTPKNHVKALDEALTRLGRAGVTLKAKKCQFFQPSVEYLGHIISHGEMRVNNKNMEALAKVGHPRTKTPLRSFLGMCNVFRRFVENCARIAAPLNQLKTQAYGYTLSAFTETQAAAFTRLRDALLHPPVLALPRREAPFTIDVDACDAQLGCALLQEQQKGQLKTGGFYSRAFQREKRNYSATEKECLGLVWAVLHLRHYDSRKPTRFVLDEEGRLVGRQPTTEVIQVNIPDALRTRVIGLENNPTTKGYSGVQRMYAAMKRCFYWESMIVDLNDFVRKFPPCAKNRPQEQRHTSPMTLFLPKEPLTEVGIDILGPLLSTVDGNRYVFVMSDRFSKLTRTVALQRITAVTVASAFLTAWGVAFGPPDCILSDQGRQMEI